MYPRASELPESTEWYKPGSGQDWHYLAYVPATHQMYVWYDKDRMDDLGVNNMSFMAHLMKSRHVVRIPTPSFADRRLYVPEGL